MPEKPDLSAELARMARRSLSTVLSSYGLNVQEPFRASDAARSIAAVAKEAGLEPPSVGASVGFSGPKIEGELVLAASFEVVARARPDLGWSSAAAQSAVNQIVVRDWAGELANQVVGHLKNRLTGNDAGFQARTPSPLSGAGVTLKNPKSPAIRPVLFRCGAGGVWFWLEVACAPDIDLRPVPVERTQEGELILFPKKRSG